jgi:hypothetical protein
MGKAYDTRQYVGSLPIPLVITAAWSFIWWVVWANQVCASLALLSRITHSSNTYMYFVNIFIIQNTHTHIYIYT